MKVLADGRIKLDANERRIGNFVLRDERTHIKFSDINQVFTHRAHKGTPVGMFLAGCFDDAEKHKGLANWLAVIFAAFSTVPDVEFLTAVYEASKACMERHPEAYGMPASAGTEEENARVEREMKEMQEFEKDAAELAG